MMLGLALSPCVPRGGSAAVFDPATLSLTGWWREYPGSIPWSGTASAGGSALKSISDGVNAPSAGTALNGRATADFDGTNDAISGDQIDDFFDATAGAGWILFKSDVNGDADPGAGARHQGSALVCDASGSGYFHTGHNNGGVYVSVFDASYKDARAATTVTNWTLLQWRISGGNIEVRANGGSWATTAAGSIDVMTGALTIGNGFGADFFNGLVAEIAICATALTNDQFDDVREYINDRYALSL